jgi:hypothetical protein
MLAEVTPEFVSALLAKAGERVAPATIAVARRGWRWLVKLPGDRVLFVPVDEHGVRRLLDERRLLATIAPRLSFAVPRPLGAIDAPIDLRQGVPGEPGSVRLTDRIVEDDVLAERFADDTARILAELHRALGDEELRTLARPVRDDEYPLPVPACARW